MPTPEANVSVPPLPSPWQVEDAVSPLTEHDGDLGRKEWWQTSIVGRQACSNLAGVLDRSSAESPDGLPPVLAR